MEDFVGNNPFSNIVDTIFENVAPVEITTDNPQPLVLTNFKPLEENVIICQISPAKFDSLLKVLNVLVSDKSSNDSLIIKESLLDLSDTKTLRTFKRLSNFAGEI